MELIPNISDTHKDEEMWIITWVIFRLVINYTIQINVLVTCSGGEDEHRTAVLQCL